MAQTLDALLAVPRTVAVVGLSPKPHRDSYQVARYLQAQGWRILPVNPVAAASGTTILGEIAYASLQQAGVVHPIDIVNVFRQSADVPAVVEATLAVQAPVLWLQLGIHHADAVARAQAAGVQVVQDLCLKVAHARRN